MKALQRVLGKLFLQYVYILIVKRFWQATLPDGFICS